MTSFLWSHPEMNDLFINNNIPNIPPVHNIGGDASTYHTVPQSQAGSFVTAPGENDLFDDEFLPDLPEDNDPDFMDTEVPPPPPPRQRPLLPPIQTHLTHSYRSVKAPSYSGPMYKEGMDWTHHYHQNIMAMFNKNPGLTDRQKSQLVIDTLEPCLKPVATSFCSSADIPSVDAIIQHMVMVCKPKAKQGKLSLVAFVGLLSEKLKEFCIRYTEPGYQARQLPYLRRIASLSLINNCAPIFRPKFAKVQKNWAEGIGKPASRKEWDALMNVAFKLAAEHKEEEEAVKEEAELQPSRKRARKEEGEKRTTIPNKNAVKPCKKSDEDCKFFKEGKCIFSHGGNPPKRFKSD